MNAKPREERQGVDLFCGRIAGLRIGARWCVVGTIFAHQKLSVVGLARKKWANPF
jgi:hypothetical protein